MPVAPADAASSKCTPKGSQGLVSGATGRVFKIDAGGGYSRVYACLFRLGKSRFLGYQGPCGRTLVSNFRLAGAYVAYDWLSCDGPTRREKVVVRAIGSGKVVRQAPAGGELVDLALTPNGLVAWTAEAGETILVRKLDKGSPKDGETLESGAGVERLLALGTFLEGGDSRIYWLKDGNAGTDRLEGDVPDTDPGVGQHPVRCNPRGSKTLALANGKRVYQLKGKDGERRAYACLYSTNKRRLLGFAGRCDQKMPAVSTFRFAGRAVAYREFRCDGPDVVAVMDIGTGKVKRYEPVGFPTEPNSHVQVSELEISATTGLVWIAEFEDGSGDEVDVRQVRKVEPGREPFTVDSDRAIQSQSLALGPYQGFNRIYYMKGPRPGGTPWTDVLAGF